MSTLLHIGAGIQFSTLWLNFVNNKSVDTFILVDSAPKWIWCEPMDKSESESKSNAPDVAEMDRYIYDITTIPPMYYGYTLLSSAENVYMFKNHKLNKTLKYYTNVYFPKDCPDALITDMANANILMICGFIPDKVIYIYLVNLDVIIITNMSAWKDTDNGIFPQNTKYTLVYITCDLADPCYPEPIDESHLESYTSDDVVGEMRYTHFMTENNVKFLSMKQFNSYQDFLVGH